MSTLAELTDDIEAELKDVGNVNWSTAELEHHIRRALRAYNRVDPQRAAVAIHSVADTREYDISVSCAGAMEILDVWYPFDDVTPEWPPNKVPWNMLTTDVVRLDVDGVSGAATEHLRVFYTLPHTIDDLDAAAATTLDAQGEQAVILGASAFAAMQYAQSLMGTVTPSGWTPRQFQDWATLRATDFRLLMAEIRQRLVHAQDSRAVMAAEV